MHQNSPETVAAVYTDDIAARTRMAEVVEDAATRLRRVCAHMADAEFQALLHDIAAIAVKYEELAYRTAARTEWPPVA